MNTSGQRTVESKKSKKKILGKKGYYFVIDAFIGSVIIFLSLMVILNNGIKPTKIQYNYEMAEEYSSFILNTKLRDINNPYIDNMTENKIINDTSLTIMEQVDLFYYLQDSVHAHDLIQNITDPMVPEKYGFAYTLVNGTTSALIYSRYSVPIEDAKVVISSRKTTFLQINSSYMFGPAIAEIKIWI